MIKIDISTETGRQTLENLIDKYGKLNVTFVYKIACNNRKTSSNRIARWSDGSVMVFGKYNRVYGFLLFDKWYFENLASINIANFKEGE
jgi:hypothetical protein